MKGASAQLEAAILAAGQASQESQFDRVLEDVISAALERLMAANETLFVETQALTAVATALREARGDGTAAVDGDQLAATAS